MRVGFGYDVHPFDASRTLVLGGVKIEGTWGLRGHSDADVVLHAIADAMLGAASLGDLGQHFPDDDPRWENAPSAVLLAEVRTKVRARGWRVANADVTVVAERPRLAPHRDAMTLRIADLLQVAPEDVGLKATTNEGLGALGRGEGIAAMAVVLLAPAGAGEDTP